MCRFQYRYNFYFIADGHGPDYISHNNGLSKKLDISLRKFNGLVIKFNGTVKKDYIYNKIQYWDHRFDKEKDCENFLKALEPYIIMQKLTEV